MSVETPLVVSLPRRAVVALAVVAGVVALAAPGWAGPAARVILVVAATVAAAAGAWALVQAVPFAGTSRFEPVLGRRAQREVPPELDTIARAVRQSMADDGRQVLDPVVLLHLRRLATARLAALRLDITDPADHQAIQRHVSLGLWAVLAPGPAGGRAQHLPSLDIPATSLPALLDELERL